MPVRVSNLARNQRALTVPIDGETLTISYLPGRLTPAAEDELRAKIDDQRGGPALASLLAEMVAGWDLTNDDGSAYPIDEPHLRELPTSFLAVVATAITEDMRPNGPSAVTSGAGS